MREVKFWNVVGKDSEGKVCHRFVAIASKYSSTYAVAREVMYLVKCSTVSASPTAAISKDQMAYQINV